MRVLLATPDCGIQPDNLEMKLFDNLFKKLCYLHCYAYSSRTAS